MKQKILSIFLIIFTIIYIFLFYQSLQKADFVEYTCLGETSNETVSLANIHDTIEQEFEMPYSKFYGLDMHLATNSNPIHATCEIKIVDKTTHKTIFTRELDTFFINDEHILEVKVDSPVTVDTSHNFSVFITLKTDLPDNTKLSFYALTNSNDANTNNLSYNDNSSSKTLYLKIYGGNSEGFWTIFPILCGISLYIFVFYAYYLAKQNKPILTNTVIQAGVLGIILFVLMANFRFHSAFIDEGDYISGGILLTKGKLIYQYYYNQHMPFLYFVTAIFSLMKAVSAVEFRLYYYLLLTLIYVGLFIRHKKKFGTIAMAILPIVHWSFIILLDELSLYLEFLEYLEDKTIDLIRSIIVSLCIYCGITSVFLCIYAIFAIFAGVVFQEIKYWKTNGNLNYKTFMERYFKLFICCTIPFLTLLIYLIATQSIKAFYEQAFEFNRVVYPKYNVLINSNNFGTNIFAPFYTGIKNFLQIIPYAIIQLSNKENILFNIIEIFLVILVIIKTIQLIRKKEYSKVIWSLFFICMGFIRIHYTFHAMTAWCYLLTYLIICGKENSIYFNLFAAITLIILLINFGMIFKNYLPLKQQPITELDSLATTILPENESIFIDLNTVPDPTYLIYKNHIPSNRLLLIFPWYFEKYQDDTIAELKSQQTNYIFFKQNLPIAGILPNLGWNTYFNNYLTTYYMQNPIYNYLWIRKK